MPGLGDSLGILEIKEMRGRPRQAEARETLERLRDQVRLAAASAATAVMETKQTVFPSTAANSLRVQVCRGWLSDTRILASCPVCCVHEVCATAGSVSATLSPQQHQHR